ncbi:helix-turn-helix domain-containing protein [Micrococcus luteus]|uniref:helix-turn-helix domain-containing protein n=1 Tax=Micrococcus luteus TaxID=1270 RepID=UPI0033C98784|nr:sigma-70 region 4 domain-containing protein [Micrococcus luteus]
MKVFKNSWSVWGWSRHEEAELPPAGAPDPLRPDVRAEIWATLAEAGDDDTVELPAWALRSLMAETEPSGRDVPGVLITDDQRGVHYRATIHDDGREATLRTLEVAPTDLPADEALFQPPVRSIVRAADRFLRAQRMDAEEGVALVAQRDEPARPSRRRRPDDGTLCEHLNARMNRDEIAERYGVSPNTVDQWLRRGRKNSPDLPWPPRTRGPRPRD